MSREPVHEIDITLLTMKVLEQMAQGEIPTEEAQERLRVINTQYPQTCPHCDKGVTP